MPRVLEFGGEHRPVDGGIAPCKPRDTVRLLIRRLHIGDAIELVSVCESPLIADMIPFIRHGFALMDAEALLSCQNPEIDGFFGLWLRDDRLMTGVVGVHLSGGSDIEIGYWLKPDVHGKGLAYEAVSSVITAIEADLGERRVVAQCRPENVSSWKLLGKLGFRDEGPSGAREGRHFLVRPASID